MWIRILVVAAGLGVGVAGSPESAYAQSKDETSRAAARQLGYAGVEAYEAGNYALASEKLEKAYAVLKVPSLGLWSARALTKLGKLIQASERYVEVTRLAAVGDAAVQKTAQAEAAQELETVQAQIPSLVVRAPGADPSTITLTIDGVAVASQLIGEGIPVNPGEHTVVAVSGAARAEQKIKLQPREQKQVVLSLNGSLKPTSESPPAGPAPSAATSDALAPSRGSSRKLWGWVAVGAGGAGLVVGGVAAGLAVSKKGTLDEDPACADRVCPRSLNDDVSSYNTLRLVSTVGFVAGGALAATGIVVLLTAPRAQTSAQLLVTPSSLELRGAF